MRIVNIADLEEDRWDSPKGTYGGFGKQVSMALGRDPQSTDLLKRHPFDVEILRVPPGKIPYPFHSHSEQWEFYQVLAGTGEVRDEDGRSQIREGDAFLFPPGEAHQLFNTGERDLTILVVADNPLNEACYYPDSKKWLVPFPGSSRKIMRCEEADYYDGEE